LTKRQLLVIIQAYKTTTTNEKENKMTNNKETKMTKTQEQLRQEGLRAARNMVRKFKAHEKARKNPK